MKNIIEIEIKNIIESVSFKIGFICLIIFNIIHFLINCYDNFNMDTTKLLVVNQMGIIKNGEFNIILWAFISISPLLIFYMLGSSYRRDYNNKAHINLLLRIDKNKYILSKMIVVICLSFLVISISLALNEVLSYITFNNLGSSIGGAPYYENTFLVNQGVFLGNIDVNNPFVYKLITIFIFSVYNSLIVNICLLLTILLRYKSLAIYIGLFSFLTLTNWVLAILDMSKYNIDSYFGGYGDITSLLIIFGIMLFINIILYLMTFKKELI